MKRLPNRTDAAVSHGGDEFPYDENNEECENEFDPEALAKEVTDPIIESMRKELEKIDVARFKS